MSDDAFAALTRALDPGELRPCLAPDVELARLSSRWQGSHAVIRNPRSHVYIRLSGAEADVAARFDGSRNVAELAVAGLDGGSLRPEMVVDLVLFLTRGGFLTTPWVDTYALLAQRTQSPLRRRLARLWRWLRSMTIRVPGAPAFLAWLYAAGGRYAFTRTAQAFVIPVAAAGVVAFTIEAASGSFNLLGDPTPAAATTLVLLALAAAFVHELGHALAVCHAGRRVLGAGFQLYLANPAFFVDSSDMVMAGRKARVVNALAGPYAEFTCASLAALGAALAGDGTAGDVLFRFAGITYIFGLVNLVPFLELDGYWLLTDLLDTPDLRPRSLAFLRFELLGRIRTRQRLTRGEWGLVAFGLVGALFTVLALLVAWLLWAPVVFSFADGLWNTGLAGHVLLALLVVLVLGPLVYALADASRTIVRWLHDRADAIRFRTERRWRVDAGEMIAALPQAAKLGADEVNDIAGRVHRRRFTTGETLVRRGDAADAFYVVRRGRCAVVEDAPDGTESVVASLGPGSTFGELALLAGTPRTATVRATRTGEVFVLDAGAFQCLLADKLAPPALAPAAWPITEVWQLDPFRHLELASATELANGGAWIAAAPGDVIVTEGERGDTFYVVDRGQLEVLQRGKFVATLSPGDFFGELALLRDAPRTATVRAVTRARLFAVPRVVFDRVLKVSFTGDALRPYSLAVNTHSPRPSRTS